MKLFTKILTISLILLSSSAVIGQYNGSNFSAGIYWNYTSTSKLYLQPNSPDELLRGIHSFLEKISGVGVELRYRVSESFIIGLSAEYLKKKDSVNSISILSPYPKNVTIDDGYYVIPVELTGYYVFPFTIRNVRLFMGGGAGFYFGGHLRSVGNIKANTLSQKNFFGFHVCAGFDWCVLDFVSVRGTLKFREIDISFRNQYENLTGTLNGEQITLLTDKFDSRISVDGIVLSIGAAIYF